MRRLLSLLLGIAFVFNLTGCGNLILHQSNRETVNVAKHTEFATVALVSSINDRVFVFCSGVWVDDNSILTANHCVEAAADIASRGSKTQMVPMGIKVHYVLENEIANVAEEPNTIHLGTAVLLDKKHDLALIRASGKAIPPHGVARLAFETPPVGEHIFIVGHPAGQYFTFMEGTVSAYRDDLKALGVDFADGPFLQLQSAVWFGNSGGGAFNANGELIGIASFLIRAPDMSFFIHLDSIRAFLADAHVVLPRF